MPQPADPGQSPPEAAASSKSQLEENVQPLKVTPEQDKLLESALRIKIMHTLSGEPLTSKQVAGKLNKTPGNIHYHIIKLYEGGLLELVRTETAGASFRNSTALRELCSARSSLPAFTSAKKTRWSISSPDSPFPPGAC